MSKSKKLTLLITSIAIIAVCIAIIVGSTVALLTSSDKINISVSSASIDVEAYVTNFRLYSANPDDSGELKDENGKTYSYREYKSGRFANGGTAEIKDGGGLEFTSVSAGDKVEFDIVVTNGVHDGVKNPEAIRVKYQTVLKLVEQDESRLFENLDFSVSVEQSDGSVYSYKLSGTEYNTTYRALEVEESETVHVSVALPVSADNNLQNLAAKMTCTLSAIQAVTENAGVALVDGVDCMTLEQAVAYAQAYDKSVIKLVESDTSKSSGEIRINKSLTFESLDGGLYAFKDVHFVIMGGASVSISQMGFTGDSYINLAETSALSFKNSEVVNCSPSKIYDEANRKYLDRAAFIVSDGNQPSPVVLDVENVKFEGCAADSLAVYLNSPVANGSRITDNTFGTLNGKYADAAIEIVNADGYSEIEIKNNSFYAETAVALNQKQTSETYIVKLANNVCTGASFVAIAENVSVELYDSGSTLNGSATTLDDIKADGGLFIGVGVAFDADGRITSGTFKLFGISETNFKNAYVSASANMKDITVYEN